MKVGRPESVAITPQEAKALLLRVAGSSVFQRSARLRDLLLDIGEQTLSGRS